MARHRKQERSFEPVFWKVGKYIRLSREDGNEISESVANQDKILEDEIPGFFEEGFYEIVDSYIDDGTSGTTDLERQDFQRMVRDMEKGRINCVIVKNLSRAFRNSANQGRFLEEFIPLYNTRFISLYQPRIDTLLDPEIVHSLEVSITGFINEQYAYKTSADVRRTFRHKREKGEFIGAFAPYGYAKDPENKNVLRIDEEAAQVVRDIFRWFVSEGMSKAGIAKRLNELGVPNPTAYKRNRGFHYKNPHAVHNDGLWNPTTVSRMLQDSLYTGVMRQGRQRVVSYKVHRRTAVPENEWFVVESVLPPIVERETFQRVQELHRQNTKTAPGQKQVHLFAGLLRCADCKKGMTRSVAKGHIYYGCRTFREKSKVRCTGHRIRQDRLEEAVLAAIQNQVEQIDSLNDLTDEIRNTPAVWKESLRLETLLEQRTKELERTTDLLDSLYLDWKRENIAREQYDRVKGKLEEQSRQLAAAAARIQEEREAAETGIEDPGLTAFLECGKVTCLTRGLLVELIDVIYIQEGGGVEIRFRFPDPNLQNPEAEQRTEVVQK